MVLSSTQIAAALPTTSHIMPQVRITLTGPLSMIEDIENIYNGYCCHRIDTYKSDGLANRLGVESCPSVVVIKDGKVQKVINNNICKSSIESQLKAN